MKILLWGTYDTGKPRIRILRDGLRASGVDIEEIHEDIWGKISDKSSVRGAGRWSRLGLRLLAAYPRLIWRYLRARDHDVVLVSYPGQLDVLVLRPFAWLRHKRIAFDWFISAFDTVVQDRKLTRQHSPLARLIWWGERLASRAADMVFMDTAIHAKRMEKLFRLPCGSVGRVWVGAEASFFQRRTRRTEHEYLQVLFYGQFIPLHGIDTIVEAARLLNHAPVQWTLIGRGQEAPRIRAMLDEQPLPALRWVEWVPYETLREWIEQADVCLGIFGTSEKAASVIPNKVFQVVACGCPLVTRESLAIRELFGDVSHCIRLVPAGDAQALANAIRGCVETVRSLPDTCHADLKERIDAAAVARQFLSMISERFPETSQTNDL
ncbi:MAG: glycosyltransferase [Xanthomonadaceae bacterium]|nr:glycosyltransferase [Xanthomonadaceae bacterium]